MVLRTLAFRTRHNPSRECWWTIARVVDRHREPGIHALPISVRLHGRSYDRSGLADRFFGHYDLAFLGREIQLLDLAPTCRSHLERVREYVNTRQLRMEVDATRPT